jgi:hypothetical protein
VDAQTPAQEKTVDVQWGGYYVAKEEGRYSLFRLLDFNQDAYHIQLFRDKFDHIPQLAEVQTLHAYYGHAPIDTSNLLKKEDMHLIGSKPLGSDDLEGYGEYLRQMGNSQEAVDTTLNTCIAFSAKPPARVRIVQTAAGTTTTPLS